MEKLYSSKTCLKMAGGGMHPPHPSLDPPLPALITLSLTTTPTSRFGFSMMRGKFCHSCFEITARRPTALAQFGHFTLKTRVRFQKGGRGSTPKPFTWVRHCYLRFALFRKKNRKLLKIALLYISYSTSFVQRKNLISASLKLFKSKPV